MSTISELFSCVAGIKDYAKATLKGLEAISKRLEAIEEKVGISQRESRRPAKPMLEYSSRMNRNKKLVPNEKFTTSQAASFSGKSVSTIRKWIKAGKLEAEKDRNGHWRIHRTPLLRTLDETPMVMSGVHTF